VNWYKLSKISQSVVGINNLGDVISGDIIGSTKNVLDHDLLKIKTLEDKIKYLKPWEIKTKTVKKKKGKYIPTFVDYLFSGVRYKKGKVLPTSLFLDKPDQFSVFVLHADPQTKSKKIVRIRTDQVLKNHKTR
tara:strand:- start:1543 stop:1941 length:399 start_codon:yes stop_codon:yes gene_type:complete